MEFTLLAPLLISLMCGLAEFGQIFRQYHVMEKGVRDAARFLSRADATACPADGAWGAAVAEAKLLAIAGKPDSSAPLLDGWSDPETVSVTVECIDNSSGAWRGPASVPVVTVTATAPYQDLGMLSFIGVEPPTLTVFHQQLVIGG